jgi:hypothetical protein
MNFLKKCCARVEQQLRRQARNRIRQKDTFMVKILNRGQRSRTSRIKLFIPHTWATITSQLCWFVLPSLSFLSWRDAASSEADDDNCR